MRITARLLFAPTRLAHSLLGVPEVGRLSNGVTILTVPDESAMCGIGVFTRGGCRFEEPGKTRGMSWLLERMIYKNNKKYSTDQIMQSAFDLSGEFRMRTEYREVVFHTAQCPKWHLDECLDMLTSIIWMPEFTPQDVNEGKEAAALDIEYVYREPSRVLFEHIHQTAYGGVGVGQPQWPSQEDLDQITPENLHAYVQQMWQPERACVVVSGATQEEVKPILEELFKHIPIAPASNPGAALNVPSPYVGGECMIYNEKPPPTEHEKFEDKNMTHLGLIFKGLPEDHPDFMALAVLQNLLGGGTAFSQGGPGKGMYTKLYRNAINMYGHWLWGIESVVSAFSDSGLFGIYSQAEHVHTQNLVGVTVMQMTLAVENITEDMVEMAKNQYLSYIFLGCEERLALIEGIGKSYVLYNKLWSPEEITEQVRALTVEDIQRVGYSLFESNLTYVVFGNTKKAFAYSDLQRVFSDLDARVKNTGSIK